MDGAIWGFVGVIVGGIITGLVTLGVELIRSGKETSLDSAKRQDDRQLGRDQFQRETLLELQRSIDEFMTASHALHGHNTPEAFAAFSRTGLQVGVLGSRVDDPLVRQATEDLVITATTIALHPGQSGSAEALDKATGISTAANARAGELIRATFVDLSSRSDLLSYPPK